jgi:hypothetical protein
MCLSLPWWTLDRMALKLDRGQVGIWDGGTMMTNAFSRPCSVWEAGNPPWQNDSWVVEESFHVEACLSRSVGPYRRIAPPPLPRGLHSSTYYLNVSAFRGIRSIPSVDRWFIPRQRLDAIDDSLTKTA